jgi:ATP-dependent RNA helicase MSS116, mitochondrial
MICLQVQVQRCIIRPRASFEPALERTKNVLVFGTRMMRMTSTSAVVRARKPSAAKKSARRTTASGHSPSFSSLKGLLPPSLIEAVQGRLGMKTMKPPQAACLPLSLAGRDVFLIAGTGSGKTLCFVLTALARSMKGGGASLVLSPTRGLALQSLTVAREFEKAGLATCGVLIGGDKSVRLPPDSDLLFATPGRLKGLIDAHDARVLAFLKRVALCVLDEADQMLDVGFERDVRAILKALPGDRQTILCTATATARVLHQKDTYMDEPVVVDVAGSATKPDILQRALLVLPVAVAPRLAGLLAAALLKRLKTVVFFPTVKLVRFAAAVMEQVDPDLQLLQLHSDLSQPQRNASFARFKGDDAAQNRLMLFASDAAARGLDFPGVGLVLQVGHTDVDQYQHRVGRTGRAGRSGESVILIAEPVGLARPLAFEELKRAHPDLQAVTKLTVPRAAMRSRFSKATTVHRKLGEQAFTATVGYYAAKRKTIGWTVPQLRSFVEDLFAGFGMSVPHRIPDSTLKKMNLGQFYAP